MSGIVLITKERSRQQSPEEDWTSEHDDQHTSGELASAAVCCYIARSVISDNITMSKILETWWPFGDEYWKPSNKIRNLVKAGALIAAEIDRLERLDSTQADTKEVKS